MTDSTRTPTHSSSLVELEKVSEELRRKNQELESSNRALVLLRNIDKIVLGSLSDVEAVIQRVAKTIMSDGGYILTAIYVRNAIKQTLEPHAAYVSSNHPEARQLEQYILKHPISQRHAGSTISRATKDLLISSSDYLYEVLQPHLHPEESEEIQTQLHLGSFYVCPLFARDEVLGAMLIGLKETRKEVSFYQLDLLERLTASVGIAVDDTILYTKTIENSKRLRVANRRLKDLDRAKDEFISMASHQLRTPLTSIKGYISMLEDGDAGSLSAEQREYLEYAFAGSERMVHLISDLLNVSRMQAGKFLIEKEPTDLTALVAEEVHNLQSHAEPKNLRLEFIPPKWKIPTMMIDENKTRQVVMNFIDNAIYYTEKGSIKVSLNVVGENVELRVVDTGIGVPKEAQSQMFTKFFRASNAKGLRPDGTGLGLYLAKRVVEDQGGTIIFESVEGKGSTFGFRLPLANKKRGR